MIIHRQKNFASKGIVNPLYRMRRILRPGEGKYKSLRKAIKGSNIIEDKAAAFVSPYVHVEDGVINKGKSATKILGNISSHPLSGSAAVFVPGGGVAYPGTSKIEEFITPKVIRGKLEKVGEKITGNEKLSDNINKSIDKFRSHSKKISDYGNALGLA